MSGGESSAGDDHLGRVQLERGHTTTGLLGCRGQPQSGVAAARANFHDRDGPDGECECQKKLTHLGRDCPQPLLERGAVRAVGYVAGAPLWSHQREVLARAGAAEIFLSVRPEQEWAGRTAGFTAHLYDALSTGGPMVYFVSG